MSAYYIVILLIGSVTLSKKIKELAVSVKTRNRDKMKVDIFFLSLTVAVIAFLIVLGESSRSNA